MTDPGPGSGLSTSDKLSIERTQLSHERTLMANVRTSTALISFGFTIYKFFADLQQHGEIRQTHRLLGSRPFGFLMIMIGVIYSVLASFAYVQGMNEMQKRYGITGHRLPLALAGVISVLGVVGLLAIIFRQ